MPHGPSKSDECTELCVGGQLFGTFAHFPDELWRDLGKTRGKTLGGLLPSKNNAVKTCW